MDMKEALKKLTEEIVKIANRQMLYITSRGGELRYMDQEAIADLNSWLSVLHKAVSPPEEAPEEKEEKPAEPEDAPREAPEGRGDGPTATGI